MTAETVAETREKVESIELSKLKTIKRISYKVRGDKVGSVTLINDGFEIADFVTAYGHLHFQWSEKHSLYFWDYQGSEEFVSILAEGPKQQ